MNPDFKTAIFEFLFDDTGGHYLRKKKTRIDYDKLISFGAFGETGENYYLFIYRDSFERFIKYGAVLFLYKPFNLEKPIHITCTDTGIDWERRNIYIQTAVHFLKNQSQDTISLEGLVEDLYHDLKKTIDEHVREETEKKEKFESYSFNLRDQEIKFVEIHPKKPKQDHNSPYIMNKLRMLHPPKDEETEIEREENGESPGPSKAQLGLCLVVDTAMRRIRFKPVIVPIKRDGTLGAVKPAVPSQMGKYHFQEIPGLLKEFVGHLHQLNRKGQKEPARIDTITQIYFNSLSHLCVDMPDELTFYQSTAKSIQFDPLKKIKFNKVEVKFVPSWDRERLGYLLVLTGTDDHIVDVGTEMEILLQDENQVYLFFKSPRNHPYFAVPEEPERVFPFFRFLTHVREFLIDDFNAVLKGLRQVSSDSLVIQPQPLPLYQLKFHPAPVLKILERDPYKSKPERMEIQFDYEAGVKKFFKQHSHVQHRQLVRYEKDNDFERLCIHLLKNDPLLNLELKHDQWHEKVIGFYFTFKDGDDLTWLIERSTIYLDKGFKIYSSRRKQFIGKTGSTVRIEMTSSIDWLEFKPLLQDASSGETLEIEDIDFVNSTVTDKRGTLHVIDREDVEKLRRLSRYAEHHGKGYRVPSRNYFLIDTLYDQRMENIPQIKDKLLSVQELGQLEKFKKIPNYKMSKHFNGTLRTYQKAGCKWLRFLQEYKLSGCLADDMGLGKTVQTLAMLQSLKDENRLSTSLLVVPVSAVPNWEMEIEKFTPALTYYLHMGAGREKDFNKWENIDLVITSYATLRNDIEAFKDFVFDYIVLDESQNIKNLTSQVSKAVKLLEANHRLALSGTPIENTSMELWSLFDFLIPGFLGTQEWFRREWALPVEKYKDNEKTEMLKQMIYPFVLRRKKEDVEKDLPEKIEVVETLKMEEEQMQAYVQTAQYYTEWVAHAMDEQGIGKSAFKILEGMLRLRQICLFPQLADPEYEAIPSVKFEHFTEMMTDILSEGHKVLVFSQFVKALTIIRSYFDKEKINYSYIDGSVDAKARGKMIKAFQEDDRVGAFLLSLKAGGVALNLTAADYVIIFDPWWNPAVEAQAIDRSHRIGQTKKVFVYRLVVKDTIEEKMLKLQEQKRDLVEKLITSETKAFKNLSKDDIMNLFRFS
jgi:SNF2 family DNA or RNA helicase